MEDITIISHPNITTIIHLLGRLNTQLSGKVEWFLDDEVDT
jgi:hypothetical protein